MKKAAATRGGDGSSLGKAHKKGGEMSTEVQRRTDTDVPRGTWDPFQRDVLEEKSVSKPHAYALGMEGVTIRRHTAALRYDLDDPSERAGAEWMRSVCREVLDTPSFKRPISLDGKARTLRRVEMELAQALRQEVGA